MRRRRLRYAFDGSWFWPWLSCWPRALSPAAGEKGSGGAPTGALRDDWLDGAVGPQAGIEAAALVRDAAKAVGGGGGGKGDIVTAGGKNADGIDDAIDIATAAVSTARAAVG